MLQPVTVGTEAFEVLQARPVAGLHGRHMSALVVDFDAGLGMLGAVLLHQVLLASLAEQLAPVDAPELGLFCLAQAGGPFSGEMLPKARRALRPLMVLCRWSSEDLCRFALRADDPACRSDGAKAGTIHTSREVSCSYREAKRLRRSQAEYCLRRQADPIFQHYVVVGRLSERVLLRFNQQVPDCLVNVLSRNLGQL